MALGAAFRFIIRLVLKSSGSKLNLYTNLLTPTALFSISDWVSVTVWIDIDSFMQCSVIDQLVT